MNCILLAQVNAFTYEFDFYWGKGLILRLRRVKFKSIFIYPPFLSFEAFPRS